VNLSDASSEFVPIGSGERRRLATVQSCENCCLFLGLTVLEWTRIVLLDEFAEVIADRSEAALLRLSFSLLKDRYRQRELHGFASSCPPTCEHVSGQSVYNGSMPPPFFLQQRLSVLAVGFLAWMFAGFGSPEHVAECIPDKMPR
jgi:hypothetical protein